MLRDEIAQYTELSGNDGLHTPIGIIGAYLDGYEKGRADVQQWIPVTERLPEIDMTFPHSERYFVQYEDGDMDVASWSNVNRFWTDHVTEPHWNCVQFQTVIAWMPLPEPWKGEDDG